jgi:hypothetical protein
MSDKTLKILLGIIAVNLTLQTVKDVGLFPTAYAQGIQRVAICEMQNQNQCVRVDTSALRVTN